MAGIEFVALLVVSTALLVYAGYVATLVMRADFYTHGQKIVQCLLLVFLPLVGALIVHWFYRLQHTAPAKPDRAFVPQAEPDIDEVRALHRHIDEP